MKSKTEYICFGIRVPKEQNQELIKIAEILRTDRNAVIRKAIDNFLNPVDRVQNGRPRKAA